MLALTLTRDLVRDKGRVPPLRIVFPLLCNIYWHFLHTQKKGNEVYGGGLLCRLGMFVWRCPVSFIIVGTKHYYGGNIAYKNGYLEAAECMHATTCEADWTCWTSVDAIEYA